MGRAPLTKKKPCAALSQKGGSGDGDLSAALIGNDHDAPPKDNVFDYVERAVKNKQAAAGPTRQVQAARPGAAQL